MSMAGGNAFSGFRKSKQGLERPAESRKRTRKQSEAPVPLEGRLSLEDPDEGLSREEQERVLKSFDLSSKFGPCTGMTRLERWARAEKLGLGPPQQVKAILDELDPKAGLQNNLWHGRI